MSNGDLFAGSEALRRCLPGDRSELTSRLLMVGESGFSFPPGGGGGREL